MTYIDYINQFWQIRRYKPMTAHEADFYFFLLKAHSLFMKKLIGILITRLIIGATIL